MTKKETLEKLLKIIEKEKFQIITNIICLFIFPIILIWLNTNVTRAVLVIVLFFSLLSNLLDTVLISVNKEIISLQNQIIDSYKKYFEDNIKQNINQENKV